MPPQIKLSKPMPNNICGMGAATSPIKSVLANISITPASVTKNRVTNIVQGVRI